MITADREPPPPRGAYGSLQALLAADGWPALAAAAVTLAMELGVFLGALAAGVTQRQAVIASLAAGVVWVALAAPAMAAASNSGLGGLLRGGASADASAALLIVLWLATPHVSLPAALKIYCIYAAVALAGVAATRCARAPATRFALAAAASIVLIAALASPFWIGGAIAAARLSGPAVAAAVYANPFYCIWSVLADQMPHAWHQAPVLYRITYLGTHAPVPAAPWYAAVIIYTAIAGVLGATSLLRRPGRSP